MSPRQRERGGRELTLQERRELGASRDDLRSLPLDEAGPPIAASCRCQGAEYARRGRAPLEERGLAAAFEG